MIVEKIDNLLTEINKKQFEVEIDKAKGNKKELEKLKKSLDTLTDLMPPQYIEFLRKKIKSAMIKEEKSDFVEKRRGAWYIFDKFQNIIGGPYNSESKAKSELKRTG